jgi:ABC-type transport system involved in cytochrome c biogenesis permease subunit
MCDEKVLYEIYEFLKKMLIEEFHVINQKIIKTQLLENIDNWSYRTIGIGFPFLTLAIYFTLPFLIDIDL